MRIEEKTTANLIDSLMTVTIKCFMAQEGIMNGKTDSEVAKAAKNAQTLNARRNKLIRAIDQRLGEADISETEKTYGN